LNFSPSGCGENKGPLEKPVFKHQRLILFENVKENKKRKKGSAAAAFN